MSVCQHAVQNSVIGWLLEPTQDNVNYGQVTNPATPLCRRTLEVCGSSSAARPPGAQQPLPLSALLGIKRDPHSPGAKRRAALVQHCMREGTNTLHKKAEDAGGGSALIASTCTQATRGTSWCSMVVAGVSTRFQWFPFPRFQRRFKGCQSKASLKSIGRPSKAVEDQGKQHAEAVQRCLKTATSPRRLPCN